MSFKNVLKSELSILSILSGKYTQICVKPTEFIKGRLECY